MSEIILGKKLTTQECKAFQSRWCFKKNFHIDSANTWSLTQDELDFFGLKEVMEINKYALAHIVLAYDQAWLISPSQWIEINKNEWLENNEVIIK